MEDLNKKTACLKWRGLSWFCFFMNVRIILGIIFGLLSVFSSIGNIDRVISGTLNACLCISYIFAFIAYRRKSTAVFSVIYLTLVLECFFPSIIYATSTEALIAFFTFFIFMFLIWTLPNLIYFNRRRVLIKKTKTESPYPKYKITNCLDHKVHGYVRFEVTYFNKLISSTKYIVKAFGNLDPDQSQTIQIDEEDLLALDAENYDLKKILSKPIAISYGTQDYEDICEFGYDKKQEKLSNLKTIISEQNTDIPPEAQENNTNENIVAAGTANPQTDNINTSGTQPLNSKRNFIKTFENIRIFIGIILSVMVLLFSIKNYSVYFLVVGLLIICTYILSAFKIGSNIPIYQKLKPFLDLILFIFLLVPAISTDIFLLVISLIFICMHIAEIIIKHAFLFSKKVLVLLTIVAVILIFVSSFVFSNYKMYKTFTVDSSIHGSYITFEITNVSRNDIYSGTVFFEIKFENETKIIKRELGYIESNKTASITLHSGKIGYNVNKANIKIKKITYK